MINSSLLICASGVLLDKNTNKISIFEIIDNLKTEGFPLLFPTFDIVFILQRGKDDESKFETNLTIRHNENVLIETKAGVDFKNSYSTRVIIKINGLAVPSPGTITIETRLREKILDTYSFLTEKATGPKATNIS